MTKYFDEMFKQQRKVKEMIKDPDLQEEFYKLIDYLVKFMEEWQLTKYESYKTSIQIKKLGEELHDSKINNEIFMKKESEKLALKYIDEINKIGTSIERKPRWFGFLCLLGGKKFINWWTQDITDLLIEDGMKGLEHQV